MTKAEEIYHRFVQYEWNEIGEEMKNSVLDAINEALRQTLVIWRLNLLEMENEQIAELVSKKIYNVTENETDFAVQLLVEKLTIPHDVKSYTANDAKKYILEALSKNAL